MKLKLPRYMELPGGVQPITRLKRGELAQYVILTNWADMAKGATKYFDETKLERKGDEAALTYTGIVDSIEISCVCSGVGGNQLSNIVEELINIGGQVFIFAGATGAIQEHINLGDQIIVGGAVRDEGCSNYYVPPQYPALADYRIVSAQVKACKKEGEQYHVGIIRTTEGFYPSQRIPELVDAWNKVGVLSVEQDTSALLTICGVRGVYGGSILTVIGNLVTGEHYWKGDRMEYCMEQWWKTFPLNIDAIKMLHKEGFPPKETKQRPGIYFGPYPRF